MATDNQNLKIADIDIDDWIDKDESLSVLEESATETTLKYSKKIVAFLDLLGITDLVKNNTGGDEADVIAKMSSIKHIVDYELEQIEEEIIMLYISDSFIFVAEPDIVTYVLKVLSVIQTRILIEQHILLRGAIEYGDVIIQDLGKQIIGPAYIDAYTNQEHNAIYPRIILGQSIIDLINDSSDKRLIQSYDGLYSLDYIDVYMEMNKETKVKISTRLRREHVFSFLNEMYIKYLNADKISIYTKYAWTINYLKEKEVWENE